MHATTAPSLALPAESKATATALLPELSELMAKVAAIRDSSNFEESLRGVFQQFDQNLRKERLQRDDRLSGLHARYPSLVEAPFTALDMRSALFDVNHSRIRTFLEQWIDRSAKEREVFVKLGAEIREIQHYFCQMLDAYNDSKVLYNQKASDVEAMLLLPLLGEIDAFARSTEQLPEEIVDLAHVYQIQESVVKVADQIKGLHSQLLRFKQLVEQEMGLSREDFRLLADTPLPPVNPYFLTYEKIRERSTVAWNERNKKVSAFLNEMIFKWHTSLIRIWLIQHQIEVCLFAASIHENIVKNIRPEWEALLEQASQFVKRQEDSINIAELRTDPKGLRLKFKELLPTRNIVEHLLLQFDAKRLPFADWLAEKKQFCVFTSLDHQAQVEQRLAKLYEESDTRFFRYRATLYKQWEASAKTWNTIASQLRKLQNFLDQFLCSEEAHRLMSDITEGLMKMETALTAFEKEQRESFNAAIFRGELDHFVANLQKYAAFQWKASDLIEQCQAEPLEPLVTKEKPRYIAIRGDDETVVAQISQLHKDHAEQLESRKESLLTRWSAIHAQGKLLSEKLKELYAIADQGGFQKKNVLETIKIKLSKNPFIDTWSERPKSKMPD